MKHIAFDNMSMPLTSDHVMLDTTDEEASLEGAGITWGEIEGIESITVELKVRGREPLHFSVVEDGEGGHELILPDVPLS